MHIISYILSSLLELICVKKVSTGQKGKHSEDNEDITMMEDTEEHMTDVCQGSEDASEQSQWSLFQVLTPLGERMLQRTVSFVLNTVCTCMSTCHVRLNFSVHVLPFTNVFWCCVPKT